MMHCPNVDKMLRGMTSVQLSEWLAYFEVKAEKKDHEDEVREANKKAKEAAKKGEF